jgi:hypothetical protein
MVREKVMTNMEISGGENVLTRKMSSVDFPPASLGHLKQCSEVWCLDLEKKK